MRWMSIPNEPGHTLPIWARSAAIDDDGIVYLPAAIVGSEMGVFLLAAGDGIKMVRDAGHCYVPANWLALEFEECSDVFRLIERRVLEHVRTS